MQKSLLFLLFLVLSSYAQESIRFGVFAYKGVEQTKKQYQPLVDELNKKLNNRVILKVLSQEEMNQHIENSELDIATTNPIHFLQLRKELQLSGAIATLRGYSKGIAKNKLAGVIAVRQNSSIRELEDLKNRVIATPSIKHMGGFEAQAYELHLNGIDILKQSKEILELKSSHEGVLYALLAGKADAGFIRDGILEEMIEKGEIKKDDIRVINEQTSISYPYKISTRLYPEWPVFALPNVSDDDLKAFISALFAITPTDELKKAGIYDYSLPVDYLETEELSRALKLPPFDKIEKISILNILYQYKTELGLIFIALLGGFFYHLREEKRKNLLNSLLSNIGEGVYGVDKNGVCIWINQKALDLLGYSEKEVLGKNHHLLFHHHKPTEEVYPTEECLIYRTSKDKKTRNLDEHFLRKNGSFIPVNLTVTAIESGGAIVVFRDMSDFIEKKIALERSENLFRTLFEVFPESIVITDLKTKLPYKFNEVAYTQLGYSADEFQNICIDQYDAVQSEEEIQVHISAVSKYGRDDFETLHRTKDGLLLDISVSVRLIYIENRPYLLSVHRDITEIKSYQRVLKHQRQRLTSILEGTNVGTWEWNIETGAVVLNEKWTEMIGYTPEELFPISLDTLILNTHPEDLPKSKEALEKHFNGESSYYECEVRMKHKNGNWIWMLDRGKVSQWDENGRPVLISGTHQDITAKKVEQQKLESLNTQIESLLQSIPDLVWMKDINGVYIICNKRFEDFFGVPREEIEGKTDYDFVSKELADFFREHDLKAMDSDAPLTNFEEISFAKDGHKEFLQTTKVAVKDKSDNIMGVLGIGRDLTEIKKNEQELKNREKLLDLFFRQSMYGFFFMMLDEPVEWNDSIDKESVLDYVFEHQRVTKINEAMLLQYEAVESDFIGYRPKDFFKGNIEEGRGVWRELFDKGQLHIDTNEKKINGQKITINGDYICLYDERGFITGHFGAQRDVTGEILDQKALKEAKEEAERANESKSSFLANMSHEIRTPMNAILGLSEIVLGTNLDDKQADYLHKIQNSSKMLLSIINDILDFSKIEANRLELEQREFNLENILSKLKMMFGQSALDKGIEFYCNIEDDIPNIIVADELRITQILINLISNAIKFTKEGSIKVDLRVTQKDEKSANILFSVIDSGIGISQEQIEKLFKPFSQADNSITRKYGGTGLGLSISSRLVAAMGGNLRAQSKEGVGSTFDFELKVGVNSWLHNTLKMDIKTMQEIPKSLIYPDLSHIKLLLVEDNEVNQEIAIEILKRVKISADIANNGREAVDIFVAKPDYYDIILMDVQMPIMDGYEATRIIREHDKEIPIIALTAAAMIEDKDKALRAGMNDHLSKPINSHEMLSNIAKWLDIDFTIKQNLYSAKAEDAAVLDLKYVMNALNLNSNLLYKILSKFLKELESDFISLPELLYANEESAKSLIHALKGVSSNIGAQELVLIATRIDALLKKSIPVREEDIEFLRNALDRAKDRIRLYLKENLPLEEELTENDFKDLYIDLLEDIKNGTMVQSQNQQLLFNLLKTKVNKHELELWMSMMDNFDYDKAYNIMKEWQL